MAPTDNLAYKRSRTGNEQILLWLQGYIRMYAVKAVHHLASYMPAMCGSFSWELLRSSSRKASDSQHPAGEWTLPSYNSIQESKMGRPMACCCHVLMSRLPNWCRNLHLVLRAR